MKKYYWIRRNDEGIITAALSESLTPRAELGAELIELADGGPIERVHTAFPPQLGEALRLG